MPFRTRSLITDVRGKLAGGYVKRLADGRLDIVPTPMRVSRGCQSPTWQFCTECVRRLDAYARVPGQLDKREWGQCPPRTARTRLSWQGHYYQIGIRRMMYGYPGLPSPPDKFRSSKLYLPRDQAIVQVKAGPPYGVWQSGTMKDGDDFDQTDPPNIPPPPPPDGDGNGEEQERGCPDPFWFCGECSKTYLCYLSTCHCARSEEDPEEIDCSYGYVLRFQGEEPPPYVWKGDKPYPYECYLILECIPDFMGEGAVWQLTLNAAPSGPYCMWTAPAYTRDCPEANYTLRSRPGPLKCRVCNLMAPVRPQGDDWGPPGPPGPP